MTPTDPIDETTSGIDEARKAVAAARRGSRRTDAAVAAARKQMTEARAVRESNHFADKFRAIIRGAA